MTKEIERRVIELEAVIENNKVSEEQLKDALELHINHLLELEITAPDSICEILLKVIAQTSARDELQKITGKNIYIKND